MNKDLELRTEKGFKKKVKQGWGKTITSLVPTFFSLSILSVGIGILAQNVKNLFTGSPTIKDNGQGNSKVRGVN